MNMPYKHIWPTDYVQPSERTQDLSQPCDGTIVDSTTSNSTAYAIVGQFRASEREKDWEAIKRLQDKGFQVIAPKEWK